jgi:hypothetical protein
MTTNALLYAAVLDILRKDIRGEAVSVTEFNAILPVVSHEYFAQQYAKFQQTQNITDSLAPFIKTATVTLIEGVASLPSDYLHMIGAPTCTETVGSSSYTRKVDMVSKLELTERLIDPITVPTATYPVATIGPATTSGYIGTYGTSVIELAVFGQWVVGVTPYPWVYFDTPHGLVTGDTVTLSGGRDSGGVLAANYDGTHSVIYTTDRGFYFTDVAYSGSPFYSLYTTSISKAINVNPTTITSISITYLAKPATPKLDYYVTDATNVRTFLAAAGTHTVASGETYPVAASAPTVAATYTSVTTEMEWLDQDRPSILYLILKKLGVTMENPSAFQFASQEQQINNRP